jgi:hypothetical protein
MTSKPGSALAEFVGDRVRDRLVGALRWELQGPESERELLTQSPATRYLLGMLAPQETAVDPVEDDQIDSTAADGQSDEPSPPIALSMAQSAIGLSFVVSDDNASLRVAASWGEYSKVERQGEAQPPESDLVDREGDPGEAPTKKRKDYEWQRTPHEVTVEMGVLRDGRSQPQPVGDGVHVEWTVRRSGNKAITSVFLVNNRRAPLATRPPDELWLYQPVLEVHGAGAPFLPRSLDRKAPDPDPDVASADLLYRTRLEFATGHGVAAEWDVDQDQPDRATALRTAVIPELEVPTLRPWAAEGLPDLDMSGLAEQEGSALGARLDPLADAYEAWIVEREAEVAALPREHQPVATDHLAAARRCLQRIRVGIRLLESHPSVAAAFRFANRAMAMQREASVRVLRVRRGQPVPETITTKWRPFQMGFMLQCLAGIADPESEDRATADLLWFPTGGGKTEAYLGLTAFTLAHRRLQPPTGDLDFSAGTAVLMRYTLRLLTIQQFQRATALICACELIRNSAVDTWGSERFSIGLWVGGSVTPNSYSDAKDALQRLKRGELVFEGSPYQLLFCPWCGSDIPPSNYTSDDDLERTLVKCGNRECAFSMTRSELGLPVLLVDQEIYRHPTSLLLATVDKFAQMAWNGRIRSLFGRVTDRCPRHGFVSAADDHPRRHGETKGWPAAVTTPVARRLAPPDLIIQDELHLISGPLGTLVGIYEAAVEGLCTRSVNGRDVRPKLLASTATIRRASRQVSSLFGKDVAVFPPQGLDASDSFFARQDGAAPGRLYVGIYAPGKSVKTSIVRVYAALLGRALVEFEKEPTPEADAYMTLVGYFNSLRELGGAVRLVDDDVPARLRVLRRRGFSPARILYETKELTSRARSSEIAATLKTLDRSFLEKTTGSYPLDVLLASNMLSVGVDIDRLGLMVVSAQPKTSAEYIQATSRVGRVHPGLVIEVYNWVRPRDTSHYERFGHYHSTFYRHVEATSVTPFSARARDRALPGVLVSYMRLLDPTIAMEKDANLFDPGSADLATVLADLVERAYRVTERDDVRVETEQQLRNLIGEWHQATQPPARRPVVYTGRGLKIGNDAVTVLMRAMESEGGRGLWRVARSLREVEPEIPVVLIDEGLPS